MAVRGVSTENGTTPKTVKVTYTEDTGIRRLHSHDISANRPIGVHFFGQPEAYVDVYSTGRIFIDGPILNPTGTTYIYSAASILSASDNGVVGGSNIELTGANGIGSAINPVRVDVASGPYANLRAYSNRGPISIAEQTGNLPINSVNSAPLGDISLSAPGSITVAQRNASLWYEGLVSGGAVTLSSTTGGIGNSALRPLVIDNPLPVNATADLKDVLTANAKSNVFLTAKTGDLRVKSVTTEGDVWINVANGSLIDANSAEVRDERTIEELKGGVWTSLQLTAGTGHADKVAASIESYKAAKTQDYKTYWQFRKMQPDGGTSYDSTFQVALTAAELAYYQAELGYDATAIQREVTNRTATYQKLNAVFGAGGTYKQFNLPAFTPNVFIANFAYRATQAELDALTGSIKLWTEEELLYGISAGLMKDVTSTVVSIENPNIVGANVTILTKAGVGMSGGQTVIDRTQANVALTIDERVALAAAERLDVQFLGGAPITTRVNFNAEARTITRTDGGSWITNRFQSGMYVTIDGVGQDKTQNATIRTTVFHRIVGVTAGVLTIGAGSPMATETARPITIAPVVPDPNFQAMAPAVTATAFFTGGTQTNVASITRTDGGSWITSGFAAGQLLRVSGSVENSTTGSLTYRIASVSASVITLTSSARITTTEAATVNLTRGILPTITAIRISHLDDINVTASGKVDITAGKNVLLGSTTDIRINQVTAGDNVTGDKIRIKGSLSILDAAAPGLVNVRGNDVILEAAQGGVGTKADRIGITFLAGGTLTARAKDGVYVNAVNSDLRLESVYSESGDAYLTADGSILELFRNDLTKIRANRVELIAKGGAIGSGAPSGWVDIEASGKVMAEAQGGIWLWQQRGDLTLDRVLSLCGDVGLRAQGSILDDVPDEDDWTGTRARPNVDVRGNAISLAALTGGIGSATSTLDIDTQYFAEGALTASSAGKNIFINEVAGTLRLNSVTTGATGTAFLTALTGGISGWPATIGPNIEAQGAVLSAVGDIGASDRRLSTKIQTIESRANPGAIWIDNMGGLSIGGDMTTQADGIVARRGAWLTASGPVTVKKNIVTGGSLVVIALDDALDGKNAAAGNVPDDIMVFGTGLSGAPLTIKAGGSIRLAAGDNLTIQAGALLQAGIRANLQGDYQGGRTGIEPVAGTANVDPSVGTKITIAGKVVAPLITISGHADQDTVTITATGTLLAMYSWTPGSWNADVFGAQRIPFKRPNGSSESRVVIDVKGATDQVTILGEIRARTTEILREESLLMAGSSSLMARPETVVAAGLLPVWQMAEGPTPTTGGDVASIAATDLQPIIVEAWQLWAEALGPDSAELGRLNHVTVEIGDLPDTKIGATVGDLIVIDRDAAGWGWFVDSTPGDDGEFSALTGPAAQRMDLLSTVLHEMGNAMGLPETRGQDVMGMMLPAGVRRVPMIDWTKVPQPGGAALATPPSWLGQFVSHLGQDVGGVNASIRIRVPASPAAS